MKKIFLITFLFLFLFLVFGQTQAAIPPCSSDPENPCYCKLPDKEGGIVPCGRSGDDPTTPSCECCPCQFCHFFVMINNVIRFVMLTLVPAVAVLMLIIGGIMFFTAGAKPGTLIRAKGTITSVVLGLVIIFCAWIIVNTVLNQIGIIDSPSLLRWWEIQCSI